MALLTQPMNQFAGPAPILGQVDQIPNPDIVSAQIISTSVATGLQNGSPVKLVAGVGGSMLVDSHLGPTDTAPVFGIIAYNERKNLYSPGDYVEVACGGSYIYGLSSAAIVRGTNVAVTPAVLNTSDPTIATDTTTLHFVAGVAVDQAAAAGVLIRFKVAPAKNP